MKSKKKINELEKQKNEEQARYNEFVLKRRREEKEAQEKNQSR